MTPNQLRKWRSDMEMTQNSLARELGIDPGTLARWERGARAIPPYLVFALHHLKSKKPARLARKTRETRTKSKRHRIYHSSTHPAEELHVGPAGEPEAGWYFEPVDWPRDITSTGQIYSAAYETRDEAVEAAERWEVDSPKL